MSVKRYDFDCYAFYDSARLDVQECEDGDYVLHSDYAALLARHNALVEAKQTISECLQDTAFRNGVKAGWNAAFIKDNTEAERKYAQLMADNDGRLASLKAARAEVDRLLQEPPC